MRVNLSHSKDFADLEITTGTFEAELFSSERNCSAVIELEITNINYSTSSKTQLMDDVTGHRNGMLVLVLISMGK